MTIGHRILTDESACSDCRFDDSGMGCLFGDPTVEFNGDKIVCMAYEKRTEDETND